MFLDGPRLPIGVANKDASECGRPCCSESPRCHGRQGQCRRGGVRISIPLPRVENTGAELKNESSDCATTEINRIINGAVDSEGEAPPQIAYPRVNLVTITNG